MVNGERLIFFGAEMDVDPSPPSSPREQADSDPYKRAEKLIQDILKARTASQFQQVIEDAAPVNLDATPQLVRSAEPPSSLAQLIIRPGESGGLLSPTEFRFAKFCTEYKLKKRTSDCLLGMLKERAFILEDLHADSIWEIEKLKSDSCKGKIREYDLWTEMDGLQEVKLYLTSLRQRGGGSHVLRARYTVADCAAHQPHTGQGAANEGLSLRLKCTNNSTRVLSSQASILQILTRRSERKRGQREPIVDAQRASVAIRETMQTRKAANQKRAQRMPYTREKAARRRAMRTAAQ
jgi:hypothetical protein